MGFILKNAHHTHSVQRQSLDSSPWISELHEITFRDVQVDVRCAESATRVMKSFFP
jgi:hypothetical protein